MGGTGSLIVKPLLANTAHQASASLTQSVKRRSVLTTFIICFTNQHHCVILANDNILA
jgi:hypothetical protein